MTVQGATLDSVAMMVFAGAVLAYTGKHRTRLYPWYACVLMSVSTSLAMFSPDLSGLFTRTSIFFFSSHMHEHLKNLLHLK